MNRNPILFAMANPVPEIFPEEVAGIDAIVATGRADYPNQVNNVLAFPGIFRGALDSRACDINEAMKLEASQAIADLVAEDEVSPDYIIPGPFNRKTPQRVAVAVVKAARRTGVARRVPKKSAEEI